MQIFSKDKTYGFMKLSPVTLAISIILLLGSFTLMFTKGLNYGIDFSGGTLIQVQYDKPIALDTIREAISKSELFKDATVTHFGSSEEVVIRFLSSTASLEANLESSITQTLKDTGSFEIRRVDMVGPKVGDELRIKGLTALLISIGAILIYIAYRFEWRFAVSSVLALTHDIIIVIGAIILFNIDVNLDILAALLTILGYSLNDTIIIFDRIRESAHEAKEYNLNEVIDYSVSKTLPRTTLTSLTTLFVVATLFFFGGEIIKGFSFTLLVGIIIGTYSSIFIASPLLSRFGFNIRTYREKEIAKQKRKLEKEKLRAQFEKGIV